MPEALRRKYATIEAEAERLAVNPRTIRRMIARGEITGYRLGGKLLRGDPSEPDAAMVAIPPVDGAALTSHPRQTIAAPNAGAATSRRGGQATSPSPYRSVRTAGRMMARRSAGGGISTRHADAANTPSTSGCCIVNTLTICRR